MREISLENMAPGEHPSGTVDLAELTDLDMDTAVGGATKPFGTWGCCWCVPWYSGFTRCGALCKNAPTCRWP